MRLIDADVAKKAVHEEFDECLVWDESGEHTANVIEEILEALPTVDAIPVEWIKEFTEESKRHIQGSVNNYTYMYDYMLSEWKQRKEE